MTGTMCFDYFSAILGDSGGGAVHNRKERNRRGKG
jgi:hypothetical protein